MSPVLRPTWQSPTRPWFVVVPVEANRLHYPKHRRCLDAAKNIGVALLVAMAAGDDGISLYQHD